MKKNNVINKIKEIRLANHWTQTEFAEILNVTQANVSNWERGKTMPNKQSLEKIAEAGNVSCEELLGNKRVRKTKEVEEETPQENPKEATFSEVTKENLGIIQSYAHLAKSGHFDFNEIDFASFVYEKITEILEEVDHG